MCCFSKKKKHCLWNMLIVLVSCIQLRLLTVLMATNFLFINCFAYCNMHCFVIVLLKHHTRSPVHLFELKLRIEDSGCKP